MNFFSEQRKVIWATEFFPLVLGLVLGVISYIVFRLWGGLHLFNGLMVIASAGSVGIAIAEFGMRRANVKFGRRLDIGLLLLTLFIVVLGVESYLRYGLGRYATWSEENLRGRYVSLYRGFPVEYYKNRLKNVTTVERKPEFTTTRTRNSLGLSEREIPLPKPRDEFRIFALGDSFTEGAGADYDSTWVKVMERTLRETYGPQIAAYNGGVSGSDPFFSLRMLTDDLLARQPDLVILATNKTDVEDFIVRGGAERFQGARLIYRSAPWWEPFYAVSFVARHIAHGIYGVDYLLMTPAQHSKAEAEALQLLRGTIARYVEILKPRGIRFLVVIHPTKHDFAAGNSSTYSRLVASLQDIEFAEVLDLLKYYIDGKVITRETASKYYWTMDLHHNAAGYEAMGVAIAGELSRLKFIDSRQTRR